MVRRTKPGPDGYEVYDADGDNKFTKSGLTTDQVYELMVIPKVRAAITAAGRFLLEADRSFAASQPRQAGPVIATSDEAKQEESFPPLTRPAGQPITDFPSLDL